MKKKSENDSNKIDVLIVHKFSVCNQNFAQQRN